MLNKHQQNDLAMRETVLKLLNDNLPKFPKAPRMTEAVRELDSMVGQIQSKSNDKDDAISGKTTAKYEAEERLVVGMMHVGGARRHW